MQSNGVWEIFDQGYPLDPIDLFKDYLYAWDNYANGIGDSSFIRLSSIPWIALQALLSYVGLQPNISQRILLIAFTAFAGWGIYFFVDNLFTFRDLEQRRISAFLAGVFYILNPFSLYWITLGVYPILSVSLLPFLLLLITKALTTYEYDRHKAISYIFVTSFITIFAFTVNFEILLINLIFLVLYVLYFLITNVSKALLYIKVLILLILITLFVNLYWILPLTYSQLIYSQVSTIFEQYTKESINRAYAISSRPLNFMQVLRLHVYPFSHNLFEVSNPLYPIQLWVTSHITVLTGLMIFSISAICILFRPKDKYILFFMFVLIIFVGLSGGTSPPLGLIYTWLLQNMIFFRIFSDPSKFMYVTSFVIATLLGICSGEIYKHLSLFNKVLSKLSILLIFSLILINVYPVLSGNMYGALKTTIVPQYYLEFKDWVTKQGNNFRLLQLPISPPGFSSYYEWTPFPEYGISVSVFHRVVRLSVPIFSSPYQPVSLPLLDFVESNQGHLGKVLSLLSIKYIVVSNDMINPINWKKYNSTYYKTLMEQQSDISFVGTFGHLSIYKNEAFKDNWIYASSVYVILPSASDLKSYQYFVEHTQNLQPTEVVFLSDEAVGKIREIWNNAIKIGELNRDQLKEYSNDTNKLHGNVQIFYKQIDPTKYVVNVKAQEPFILVLNQHYDLGWRAEIVDESLNSYHLMVNFYANGWYIPKSGNYEIIIYYEPQTSLNVGILISSTTTLLIITYSFTCFLSRMRKTTFR
jgi:hypothetical protein